MTKYFHKWRPHPWHGLDLGPKPPEIVHAFIEATPFDYVKYEVDKKSGFLRVDRPLRTSSLPPTLYGFIPQTYCDERVKALMPGARRGDHDPLDICVISNRRISHGEIILDARIVGGIPMIDNGEADDKIVSVLHSDDIYENIQDISELPESLVERLRHYFATYKTLPDEPEKVKVGKPYGRERACKVIEAAMADYKEAYVD